MKSESSPQFLEVATIQERLDDPQPLIAQMTEDPADLVASGQLEDFYRNSGNTEDLLDLLLTRAENVATDSERVEILRDASRVCSGSGDHQAALMILLTAFELDAANTQLADEIDSIAFHTGQWDEVLDAYLLAAANTEDRECAGHLWLRIACTHLVVTKDASALATALEHVESVSSRWAPAYLDLVERKAHSREIVISLANLCHRIGDEARRARCLTRGVAMTGSAVEKAELHSQLSKHNLRSEDRVAANWHLREALRLDPGRQDCLAALVALTKEDGNIRGAAQLLRATAHTGMRGRSDAAFEAAALYSDLDENTSCYDLLAVAMSADPNHVGAALPLANRYFADKRWAELEPLIDMLSQRLAELPTDAIAPAQLLYRGGVCAKELGKLDKAKELYTQALAIVPRNEIALTAYQEVCEDLGHTSDAMQACETLLHILHGEKKRAGTFYRMALIRHKEENRDDAFRLVRRAIESDPEHLQAGGLLATLHEECSEYRGAIAARAALIPYVSADVACKLYCEIAELRCWKLDDPMGAIEDYESARLVEPGNRKVLHRLMELLSAAEMWRDAVDILLRIAELETSPFRQGKYYEAAGTIVWHELKDPEAARCFNLALDCFFVDADLTPAMRPSCMRAFHRLVDCLQGSEDYLALERCYRKMLQRLSPDDSEVVQLWTALGNLYKTKLNRPEDAIASYEVVSSLDSSTNHKRVLVGLYEGVADKHDKALEQRLELLQTKPFDAEHYAALIALYIRNREPDRAWCATQALEYLDQASEVEATFYYKHLSQEMPWPRMPVTNGMWSDLRHEDENKHVNQILSLVADAILGDCAVDEAALMARDGKTPLHDELRSIVGAVGYALGMPAAHVTVDLELQATLLMLPTKSGLVFVAGRGLWQTPTLRGRVDAVARILACARPHAQLRHLSSSPEQLEAVFMAALTYVRPDIGLAPAMLDSVQEIHKIFAARLTPARQVRLGHAVQALISSGERHDLQRWWNAIDCTAQRVGLLLSGDLEQAALHSKEECTDAQYRIADLLCFAMSSCYGEMRDALGIAICEPTSDKHTYG